MMATVKPAMTSYRMFFFQSYFGSQLRMGTARPGRRAFHHRFKN